jgi:hypothetical protein
MKIYSQNTQTLLCIDKILAIYIEKKNNPMPRNMLRRTSKIMIVNEQFVEYNSYTKKYTIIHTVN